MANRWGVPGGNHTPRRLRAPNTQAADLQFLPVEPPPAGCLSMQDAGPASLAQANAPRWGATSPVVRTGLDGR